MTDIKVVNIGRYNLINVDGFSGFTMAHMSPEYEKNNIIENLNNLSNFYGEVNGLEKLKNILNLKNIEGLTDYKLNIEEIKGGCKFLLPISHNRLSEIQLIQLTDEQKNIYVDSEIYNFYIISDRIRILDKKDKFGDSSPQAILLVPIDVDKDKYIKEFIADSIYENYFNNKKDRFDNFLLSSITMRLKYNYYPTSVHINLVW